jgi:rRNA-processing protein FCF1
MPTVLIDACGWVAVVDGGIHIDHALAEQVGPVELAITAAGRAELERLQGERSATLLLDLLDSRAEVVLAPEGVRHTDDQLIRLAAQLQCPVLTVDRELKRRLIAEGSQIIEVVGGSALRLVS